MRKTKYIAIAGMAAMALATSCLDKTVPAPDFSGEILSLEVYGQIGASVIDPANRTVSLKLGEAVEMDKVIVSRIDVTEAGSCEIAEGDVLDLTVPKKVIVKTVSGYEWTISATQTIGYRFEVKGVVGKEGEPDREVNQIGQTLFEMHTHRVFAYLPVGTDLTRVRITALKLAPEGVEATYTPDLSALLDTPLAFRPSYIGDNTAVRRVEVEYRGVREAWELYVTENDTVLETVDPFAYKVDLTAFGLDESVCGFEYRTAAGYDAGAEPSAQGWIRVEVAEANIDTSDGSFSTTINGLTPETEYIVRAFSGESMGDVEEFTTTGTRELPGGGFDEWHKGKDPRSKIQFDVYNPWPEGGVWEQDRWWDSGNKGVAVAGYLSTGGNTLPSDEPGCPADPDGCSAKLQSVWALVKSAGGNIYFGEFGSMVEGTLDATCHLGHNWAGNKPTRLKGWYKYFPQKIDNIVTDHYLQHPLGKTKEEWLASTDSLHVCVALWASPDGRDIPFTVNTDTRPGQFRDFARTQPGVIAYGAFISSATQAEWAEFEIPIEYLKTGELPANTQLYLLITSSKSCNYFIAGTTGGAGGKGSLMYVDELKLEYD